MTDSQFSFEFEQPEPMSEQERDALLQPAIQFALQLLQQGETDKSIEALERLYKVAPDNQDVALNLSAAYILRKQFRKAVPVLEILKQQHPDNPMVWTNLGAAYLGNPVLATDESQLQSIDAFKYALKLDPHAPNVAYNIGLIYKDRRENEQALRYFQRAIRTRPDDKDARYWISKLKEVE